MENIALTIDLRNIEVLADRPKKVSRELEKIKSGEYAKIISDDKRRLTAGPRMIEITGDAEHIKSFEGEDGLYYSLIRKK
jgi:TusA-related sulfurtransferase